MSRRTITVLLVFVALFAAACTSEGLPNSYTDQDRRAERQFIEACESSLVDTTEQNPSEFCQCAFYTIAAELTFDEFVALDDQLREDPEFLSVEERALLASVSLPCEFNAGDVTVTAESG